MNVFISYAWEDEEHKAWVREFATMLCEDGIEVYLDQWDVHPGDQLPEFMEKSIRENDFVLIICTPEYKERFNQRKCGSGEEGHLITAEMLNNGNDYKFIPILRRGTWVEAAPSALLGKYYIDLSEESNFKSNYDDLINTLYGKSPKKPIIKRKETKKDENIKFELAVERIMGRAWFAGSEIRYEAGELFSEDDIKEISRNLERYMDYTKKEYWIPVLTRAEVDDLIDGSNWKKDGKEFFFNEPERQKLMERCAKVIKFRLNGCSKRYTVRYKIFDKGDVGFRYE